MSDFSLKNKFLIAMPALDDPNFFHSVAYICEHNKDGALGIVINYPMDILFGEMLGHMQLDAGSDEIAGRAVYSGGPVHQERGFVIHSPVGQWDSSLQVSDEVALTTSRDVVEALARGEGPSQALVALGYAGWGAGQLEEEIANNAWISGPADPEIIFKTPVENRWRSAAALLGVDINFLSNDVGHA